MTLRWIWKINNQKMRLFVLIFMVLMLSAPLLADEVKDIRTGLHPDKTRLVIDFTGALDFNAQTTHNPNQLIVHLHKKSIQNFSNTKWQTPFLSMQASEIDNQFSKFVFGLDTPKIVQSAFVIEGTPNRLVIDLVTGNEENTIHGPLTIDIVDITKTATPPYKPIIMIDAGHGGFDPGAVSPHGIREKDITLSIATLLANHLNEAGRYNAKLTRQSDEFINLYDRVTMAQDAKADLFISIHADSLRGEQASGASIYTLSKEASDAQTAKLVARENAITTNDFIDTPQTNINEILVTMAMEDTIEKSKNLAKTIIQTLEKSNVQTITTPHRHGGFVVLKSPEIPSILFETGFISDNAQAKKLMNPSYQKQIADALLQSIDDYFGF